MPNSNQPRQTSREPPSSRKNEKAKTERKRPKARSQEITNPEVSKKPADENSAQNTNAKFSTKPMPQQYPGRSERSSDAKDCTPRTSSPGVGNATKQSTKNWRQKNVDENPPTTQETNKSNDWKEKTPASSNDLKKRS